MTYQGMRATVMGLGLFGGGGAAARWLVRQGAVVTVTDTAPESRLAVALRRLRGLPIHRFSLGGHLNEDFCKADLVVVNPAVPPGNPWLELAETAGARLTSETELFLENCPASVIGVTGSNGKSTTAAMIASILEADGCRVFLGGNIGVSLLDQLDSIGRRDWVVLELSSFQLHRLGPDASMPDTAVVTNFTPNHLNWHPDLEHYRRAKQKLISRQPAHAVAVFDPESSGLNGWRRLVRGSFAAPRRVSHLPPLAVPGRHNQANAALAAAAASLVGCRERAIDEGVRGFRGLPDRLEAIASVNGRRFFNDSSSTTPESTIAALETLDGPIWLLAGGANKGADHGAMADCIAKRSGGAVFFGKSADDLAKKVKERRQNAPCYTAQTLADAFHLSTERAPEKTTIVLSPGCSSHDQFVNYRARGAAFVELVEAHRENARHK